MVAMSSDYSALRRSLEIQVNEAGSLSEGLREIFQRVSTVRKELREGLVESRAQLQE
jgi:hypothetical protein